MRDRPHPNHKLEWPGGVVPEWAKPKQGMKRRGKGGPRHERQGGSSPGKRERLQKVMAQSGHGSRRNIEILIAQGHLTINGQVAKLGDSVGPGDKVKLDGNLISLRFGDPLPRVLMYHKPDNEIVTRDDPEKRATVFDKLPKVHGGRWVSVGRLDLNTSGLLLFTTSGELANRMTHPRFEVEREYAVRVMGEITPEIADKLLKTGVEIDGDNCKFDSLEDRGGEGSNHWYHVVLREGKNREVRKMMEAVGLMVSRLMRVRFGNVQLPGHIKRGMFREMEEEQVQELLAFAGMNEPAPSESASSDDEEDEMDNIGNRAGTPQRQLTDEELDDLVGNRVLLAQVQREVREADGNRGHYDPNAGERPAKKGPRRPHGGGGGGGGQGKTFGFKKRGQGAGGGADRDNIGNRDPGNRGGQGHRGDRGDNFGNRADNPGNRDNAGNRGDNIGNRGGGGEGHGGQQRRHGHGKPGGHGKPQGAQAPQGPRPEGPQGPAQGQGQPGQPGQGKRNRRNKNRNRNRGGGGGGGGGGANAQPRVEQPVTSGNGEPG